MAQPAYIICASGKSEDRETNALTLFELVERVILDAPTPSEPQAAPVDITAAASSAFRATVVSVWLKEPADYGAEFDSRFCLVSPSGVEQTQPMASFTMKPEATHFLHRVIVNLHGLPALRESGVWKIEVHIRPTGGRWVKQGYPLIVDASEAYLAAVAGKQSALIVSPAD